MGSIAENPTAAQATVETIRLRVRQAVIDQAQDLSLFVFRAAQRVGLVHPGVTFTKVDLRDELTSEQRGEMRASATVAIRLLDPCERGMANEQGALAILRHIARNAEAGNVDTDSPLRGIDITLARELSRVSLESGLNFLAGKDVV